MDREPTIPLPMSHERLKAISCKLVDPKIKEHRGRTVKNTGDGMLVELPSVVDAVRCAVEVGRRMVERIAATPPEKRIEFRVGINLGDVIVARARTFSATGVNIAARSEALAALLAAKRDKAQTDEASVAYLNRVKCAPRP
jgi:adenylate cyclase